MYKLKNGINGELIGVIRLEDNAGIPADKSNADYQAYLAWIEEGNEPESAD